MKAAGAILVMCCLVQGWATGSVAGAVVAGLVCVAGWRVTAVRHGLASLSLGGAGMALGAVGDHALGLGGGCHDTMSWSLATPGMVAGCTLGCAWACRTVGSRPTLLTHVGTLMGMLVGEQTAVATSVLIGTESGHWTMTTGMALGATLGAWATALLRESVRSGTVLDDVRDRRPVELGEHR